MCWCRSRLDVLLAEWESGRVFGGGGRGVGVGVGAGVDGTTRDSALRVRATQIQPRTWPPPSNEVKSNEHPCRSLAEDIFGAETDLEDADDSTCSSMKGAPLAPSAPSIFTASRGAPFSRPRSMIFPWLRLSRFPEGYPTIARSVPVGGLDDLILNTWAPAAVWSSFAVARSAAAWEVRPPDQ